MRYAAGVPLVIAITVLTACDRQSTSGGPASLTPTALQRPSVSVWDVTTTFTGATGADPCSLQQHGGTASLSPASDVISVVRIDDRITFVHNSANPPSEQLSETGTVEGNEFTANSISWPTNKLCADGRVLTGTFDASVTGHFLEDGRHLTGKETSTYHFSSGESTLLFDWSGVER